MQITTDEREFAMPRPEQDPDEHDAQADGNRPREQVVADGNPGVPQSEYVIDDDTPPPGPAAHSGSDVSPDRPTRAERVKRSGCAGGVVVVVGRPGQASVVTA